MIRRLAQYFRRLAVKRQAFVLLGPLLLAAVGLTLLLPGSGLATELVFQSGVTSPPTATPIPPPPTDTPPAAAPTGTPVLPTDTPVPPTDTPGPPTETTLPPTDIPTAVDQPAEPAPTETQPALPQPGNLESAAAVPVEPTALPAQAPDLTGAPGATVEAGGGDQPFVINRVELVDTLAVSFSYLVICCGAGLLLLIPLVLLFLQLRGNRILRE